MEKAPKIIITHDGKFHADEVSAIALIKKAFNTDIPVERRREISKEEYEDSDIWLIDVGSRYNASKGNFDHHHDDNLPSSNVLVLKHLLETEVISVPLYDQLQRPFSWISTIDTVGYKGINGFQVNSLINSLNFCNMEEDKAFDYAVNLFTEFINAAVNTVGKEDESLMIWSKRKSIHKLVAQVTEYPIKWKAYGQEPFLVCPNDKGTGFKVHSRDAATYPIVDAKRKSKFIHNNGFLALFMREEDAVECALNSAIIAERHETAL